MLEQGCKFQQVSNTLRPYKKYISQHFSQLAKCQEYFVGQKLMREIAEKIPNKTLIQYWWRDDYVWYICTCWTLMQQTIWLIYNQSQSLRDSIYRSTSTKVTYLLRFSWHSEQLQVFDWIWMVSTLDCSSSFSSSIITLRPRSWRSWRVWTPGCCEPG